MNPLILAAALVAGVVIVLFFRRREKRVFALGREALDEPHLIAVFAASLDATKLLEVLRLIGHCYEIDYRLLRPQDCFIGDLSKADSWSLDAGAEKLEANLKTKFGLDFPHEAKAFTISDLLNLITHSKNA